MTNTVPPPDPADGSCSRLRWLDRADRGMRVVRQTVARYSPQPVRYFWRRMSIEFNRWLPKGLLARSLLIIVLPMLILLTVLTSVFMDRHWLLVTDRLSSGVVRNVAALVNIAEAPLPDQVRLGMLESAGRAMQLDAVLLPQGDLGQSELDENDIVHRMLAQAIQLTLNRPYTIANAEGSSVRIRIPVNGATLEVVFPRNIAYAANWHFFLVWMMVTATVLILISTLFIRNQIKPIQRLADAAEAFGKGQPVQDFSPAGAREVRRAAYAFIGMRRRIERQIEQRTTMLAGVSHDLRTILTRFRLELALQPESEETSAMRADIGEMEAMLNAYLDFARGDPDEEARTVSVGELLRDALRLPGGLPKPVEIDVRGDDHANLRATAIRRMLVNLVGNALRYGRSHVHVLIERGDTHLVITVDDDGPGVPEAEREAVFKPFYRLDQARNQDIPGTGLGLAIARDAARSHGGDIHLESSPQGGLRVVTRLPV
ncbi:ATP-binding protein [Oryzibacter oryziterrae]|uniref:ATP-binding protein n=1 Tax=Oryzibacter oryziterrae TaxID=2766474 RepID=UPI001F29C1B3|nr:ATP-binding protein [Oryzibacter oryziterrae]